MSDETQTPTPEQAPSMGALFLGVVTGETESDEQAQDTEQGAETPDTPAPEAAAPGPEGQETTTPPPADEEIAPLVNQQEVGRAFKAKNDTIKALEDALRKAEAEKAYLAGLAEGRTPQQQAAEAPKAKVDDDPEPDPAKFEDDDAAYFAAVRAWDRRQAVKEAEAKFAPRLQAAEEFAADQAWNASMARAQAAAGDSWDAVVAYTTHMRQVSPGFDADLNAAKDPGAFALNAYRLAVGLAPVPAGATPPPSATPKVPTPAPAPTAGATSIDALLADPKQREAVLRLLAAEKAAKGEVPQVPTGPRGIGSSPGAAGAPDGLSVEAIRTMSTPKLEEARGVLFGNWIQSIENA